MDYKIEVTYTFKIDADSARDAEAIVDGLIKYYIYDQNGNRIDPTYSAHEEQEK